MLPPAAEGRPLPLEHTPSPARRPWRRRLGWFAVLAIAVVPVAIAAASPLQASRDGLWVIGGMAGVVALALLFLQPVLIGGFLPLLRPARQRRWHRITGSVVAFLVFLHVLGLYLTSPEDITDALLLVSPTPFAVYGVMGLVGIVLTVCLAAARRHLGPASWRGAHLFLAAVIVVGSVVHAVQIDGVMGNLSKLVLCGFVSAATLAVILKATLVSRRPRALPARSNAVAETAPDGRG